MVDSAGMVVVVVHGAVAPAVPAQKTNVATATNAVIMTRAEFFTVISWGG
ncbi:MAG: hypothetical protein WCI47_01900 [bacterium]